MNLDHLNTSMDGRDCDKMIRSRSLIGEWHKITDDLCGELSKLYSARNWETKTIIKNVEHK